MFKRQSKLSYIFISVLAIINVSIYCLFSKTKESSIETLSLLTSQMCKGDKFCTLSFTDINNESNNVFDDVATYCYEQSFHKVDIKNYDTRMLFNNNDESAKIEFDILGSKHVGIICKNMTLFEESNKNVIWQTNLKTEFSIKPTTKTDYKDKPSNYIYIRESDADLLISSPGTIYYGLTHEELIGKPLDVTISHASKSINDQWKIQNIILENIDEKREENDAHLKSLYGDYFLSSVYCVPVSSGFCVDIELSNSESSNSRNIKRGLTKFDQNNYYASIYSPNIENNENAKKGEILINEINANATNNTILIIVSLSILVIYATFMYFAFSKIKTFNIINIPMVILVFAISYALFSVLASISIMNLSRFFSNYAIGINLLSAVDTILLILIAKEGRKDLVPDLDNEVSQETSELKKHREKAK